ncbi:MAG: hypothetical protein GC192_00135 [Bacteroidetes bacterium]|nr:hypothetical protein [Bacteroidota bacterium]
MKHTDTNSTFGHFCTINGRSCGHSQVQPWFEFSSDPISIERSNQLEHFESFPLTVRISSCFPVSHTTSSV